MGAAGTRGRANAHDVASEQAFELTLHMPKQGVGASIGAQNPPVIRDGQHGDWNGIQPGAQRCCSSVRQRSPCLSMETHFIHEIAWSKVVLDR